MRKQIKKGGAELMTIVVAVVVIGTLAVFVGNLFLKETTNSQDKNMAIANSNLIDAIKK